MKTSELFVSHRNDESDIHEVFATQKEADKANEKNNDHYEEVIIPMMGGLITERTPRRPYKVMTLWDAIEQIKDHVLEEHEYSKAINEMPPDMSEG